VKREPLGFWSLPPGSTDEEWDALAEQVVADIKAQMAEAAREPPPDPGNQTLVDEADGTLLGPSN
jgi:hypothetical protein